MLSKVNLSNLKSLLSSTPRNNSWDSKFMIFLKAFNKFFVTCHNSPALIIQATVQVFPVRRWNSLRCFNWFAQCAFSGLIGWDLIAIWRRGRPSSPCGLQRKNMKKLVLLSLSANVFSRDWNVPIQYWSSGDCKGSLFTNQYWCAYDFG